ncbi:MAG: aminomethyl-transferring glycine dehydrogenase subunit GcvPB [Chloroflexi bacterium]|nr:aminomethyl-transferring glycine dehydrogenase subunit GcvPB [Chloroflexota bacterium]
MANINANLQEEAHNKRRTLMERSKPGRTGAALPASDVPPQMLPEASMLRDDLELPEVTEGEVVRYFTYLSQLNFSVDTNFYPLGSCTMKYNPRINEAVAALPGFAMAHPLQSERQSQGTLEALFTLQEHLREVTGMAAISLTPLAGAHGELAGILTIRAALDARGQSQRRKMLIPDTAHGTNPASAAMAGFDVVSVPSDPNGNIDVDALRAEATDDLAGVMFTQPTTLGLFDRNAIEMCKIVHDAGGLVYGDGANMNALLGRVKLGEIGFDVVHMNLHKTFSTPHGGGGPGAGPICVVEELAPFLPGPVVEKREEATYHSVMPEHSIGRMGGYQGNFGVLIRALTYITLLGDEGMLEISGNAVLNANYLLAKLRPVFELPYDRSVMHEVVFSAKRRKGASALDVSKRLLDHGFHAPTMYFPLVVAEALMIEPTETESKETLDAFIETLFAIDAEAAEDEAFLHGAPYNTPVSRMDEARAARQPHLRWEPPEPPTAG